MAGAVSGALGVGLGAFGAHALKSRLTPDMLAIFETGSRYHLIHAVAILVAALAADRWPSTYMVAVGWLFVGGIVLFSGSLYVLALTGVKSWGMVTPVGGLLFIAGWLVLAWAGVKG